MFAYNVQMLHLLRCAVYNRADSVKYHIPQYNIEFDLLSNIYQMFVFYSVFDGAASVNILLHKIILFIEDNLQN